jgi:hypothetical protein
MIHGGTGSSTPNERSLGDSVAKEKRIIFINVRKNINGHYPQ